MSGSKSGGRKAAATNKERYGKEYYASIGAKGGSRTSQSKGFAYNTVCNCNLIPEQHFNKNCAGIKGGRASSRTRARR